MTAAMLPVSERSLADSSGAGDRWIRWTTTASVVLLAGIAALVSYRHMHALALAHGESACTAMLIPLSVDGMVVASSMTLLADSRAGRRGGLLPWVLLAVGSAASLGANVAVAEPTVYGRVIAAWPSFALIAAYELLMRQIRLAAAMAEADRGTGAAEVVPATEGGSDVRPFPVAGAVQPVVTAGSPPMDADLVARARQLDAEHRARHDRPASAETIRRHLRIGAQRARDLKIMLRASNSQPTTRTRMIDTSRHQTREDPAPGSALLVRLRRASAPSDSADDSAVDQCATSAEGEVWDVGRSH